jgi:flavorubredoxin
MLRDFRHDASYVSPWAALYRRQDLSLGDVVLDYDRAWSELRAETLALRTAVAEARRELEARSTAAETEELRKEILRLRDLVVGKEAELATALGRVTEMESMIGRYDQVEQRLTAVLGSSSWRIGQAVTRPINALRKRAR